jgi:hypothetical protein
VYISVSVYQQMTLALHDDIISAYISVSVYQHMSLTLHDDIISAYISVSVYQQMSLTLHDDIISVYVVYKLWFCTCYNMCKIIVHVITWTMQKYEL